MRIADEQLAVVYEGINRDAREVFTVFVNNPLADISLGAAKNLFSDMVNNTKKYLTDYALDELATISR